MNDLLSTIQNAVTPFDPSQTYGTPSKILDNLQQTESSGNPHAVNPQTGAMGAYQFMPSTVAMLNKQGVKFDPFDPKQARAAADYYLNQLTEQNGGNLQKAIAEYGGFKNQDPTAYVDKVMGKPTSSIDVTLANGMTFNDPNESKSSTDSATSSPLLSTIQDAVNQSQPSVTAPDKSALGSNYQNFMAGVGKGVVDTGIGAKELGLTGAAWLENKFPGITQWSQTELGLPSAESALKKTEQQVDEEKVLDQPLMGTKAGMGGDIVGNLATTLLPLGAASEGGSLAAKALLNPVTYKAAITTGALQGALQPTGTQDSRMENTVTGGLLGAGSNFALNTLGHFAQPVQNIISNAHQKAVEVLKNAGIPLDAAQLSGSTFLKKLRSYLPDNPITAGAQSQFTDKQQTGFNRAVLNIVGENANHATPDVMGRAQNRINNVFKDVLSRNNIKIHDQTVNQIGDIQEAANLDEKKPINNLANRIVNVMDEKGEIPGQTAYTIKKDLDRYASSSDTTLAYHARQLRSTLMNAIKESLPEQDKNAFDTARSQFSILKNVEGSIDNMGNGNISPSRLANILSQKRNRPASIYGKGSVLNQKMIDLAQSGKMLLPDHNPNSGSIARLAMQSALPIAAGTAQGLYTG
ncbi:MAG: lytic transglycosylase domain-containing protein, partial [Pseudomonadota bacterium]|nr:lytic transglycosylase domain-containing protein [Pseudomonadota bacterium]